MQSINLRITEVRRPRFALFILYWYLLFIILKVHARVSKGVPWNDPTAGDDREPFRPRGMQCYSGKRLEVTTLLGEDLSDTSPSGDLIFSLIFIDTCIPQPNVITGIYRHKNLNEN